MSVNNWVSVIADSISPGGIRLTTLQLRYPRFIHSEFMTHRVFSRNASSSRAIPVKKVLRQVWTDPAIPEHWGANQAGMQARAELSVLRTKLAKFLWKSAGKVACVFAWGLMKLGLHKQVANRILEPWQYIHVIVTATDWDNFFTLRLHPDAQPEIRYLASDMFGAMQASTPRKLQWGQWHLPYVGFGLEDSLVLEERIKASVARCARVSFMTHDGKTPRLQQDLDLHDRLVASEPMHASPAEHQAYCAPAVIARKHRSNFRGWIQYRKLLESGAWGTLLARKI